MAECFCTHYRPEIALVAELAEYRRRGAVAAEFKKHRVGQIDQQAEGVDPNVKPFQHSAVAAASLLDVEWK